MKFIGFKLALFALLLFLNMAIAWAQSLESAPEEIIFAHEKHNAFPWVYLQGEQYVGLDIELILLVAQRLRVKAKFQSYPWIRALTKMKYGTVDAVFASSYKKEREKYGSYPMAGDAVDVSKQLHLSDYSLYILEGSPLSFDGDKFMGIIYPIGVQRNFSIVAELHKFHVPLSETTDDPLKILHQLYRGRLSAAALQTGRADKLINDDPLLKKVIKKYASKERPFQEKPYFVMFSKQFISKYPGFAQQFWDTLAQVKKSRAFAEKVRQFNSK